MSTELAQSIALLFKIKDTHLKKYLCHIRMRVYAYVYACICMYIHTYMYTYVTYIQICVCTHIHPHIYTYICKYNSTRLYLHTLRSYLPESHHKGRAASPLNSRSGSVSSSGRWHFHSRVAQSALVWPRRWKDKQLEHSYKIKVTS